MGIDPNSIQNPKTRQQVLNALGAGSGESKAPGRRVLGNDRPSIQSESSAPPARLLGRLRQNPKPVLNKLETEYFNLIKDKFPNFPPVRPQAKTFRLCNGVRYTPDLSCSYWPVEAGPSTETCWEIKGPKSWDDAIVKIKMAAHEFPEICWRFVWKESGEWREQIVLA